MDLSKFDTSVNAETGVFMPLRSPADGTILVDEETGEQVGIVLLGEDSNEFQSYQHSLMNRRLKQQSSRQKIKTSSEELEDDATQLLIRVTKELRFIDVDGKRLTSNAGDVRLLYTHKGLRWIREAVDSFILDRSNFLGNSQGG